MSSTNARGPNPANPVMSVTTDDIMAADATTSGLAGIPTAPLSEVDAPVSAANDRADDAALEEVTPEGKEQEVWEGDYDLGNFAGRIILGAVGGLVEAYLAYETYLNNKPWLRPLVILLGLTLTLGWIWLIFRMIRARMGHHYRLTTNRLFVSSGIFRRTQDMMELEHLKEVSVQQGGFLQHLCKIGTVTVTSNVQGAPTLFLLGVKYPQQITDKIYHHARN